MNKTYSITGIVQTNKKKKKPHSQCYETRVQRDSFCYVIFRNSKCFLTILYLSRTKAGWVRTNALLLLLSSPTRYWYSGKFKIQSNNIVTIQRWKLIADALVTNFAHWQYEKLDRLRTIVLHNCTCFARISSRKKASYEQMSGARVIVYKFNSLRLTRLALNTCQQVLLCNLCE